MPRRRYFMTLSYRGAQFHGWQIQPGDVSVQQTLEKALSTLLRQPTQIVGAGRTDAGVNARCMVAHFDAEELSSERLRMLPRQLTSICRPDIAIYSVFPVHDDAHARFDATSRTYRYFVNLEPDPFAYPLSWQAPPGLDIAAMNDATRALIGRQDFTSFSKLHTDVKTNICDVRSAEWRYSDDTHVYFEITADRFLRNMVRAVVGTLVDVGRHKTDSGTVRDILMARNRCAAGTSMPGNALFLWDIQYPYPITNPKTSTI